MNTTVATLEGPSVYADMAARYGMNQQAFERTLMATVVKDANASKEQVAAFLLVAKQHGLNPFTREIFAFPAKGGGIQAVVSVDGWMKLINGHPDFDGMEFTDTLDNGQLVAVTCKIYRKGRTHPVAVTEYMAECRRGTDTWKQWPARMLRHKAAIQCARYAFGFAGIVEPDEAERAIEVRTVPPALIADERKARHDAAYEQYEDAVIRIKEAIAEDDPDFHRIAETWSGIPSAAQMDLWLAPTKGGCFTTHEREVIRSPEVARILAADAGREPDPEPGI